MAARRSQGSFESWGDPWGTWMNPPPESFRDVYDDSSIVHLFETDQVFSDGDTVTSMPAVIGPTAVWYDNFWNEYPEVSQMAGLNSQLAFRVGDDLSSGSPGYQACFTLTPNAGTENDWTQFWIGYNNDAVSTWQAMGRGTEGLMLCRGNSGEMNYGLYSGGGLGAGTTPSGAFAIAVVGTGTSVRLYTSAGAVGSAGSRSDNPFNQGLNFFRRTDGTNASRDWWLSLYAVVEGSQSQDMDKLTKFFIWATGKYGTP